jgi:hypothetical protein
MNAAEQMNKKWTPDGRARCDAAPTDVGTSAPQDVGTQPNLPSRRSSPGRGEQKKSEKSKVVTTKRRAILRFLAENAELFRRQGSIETAWRGQGPQRRGPFYRLRYRHQGRQCVVHLGGNAALAEAVRGRLEELQAPLRREREDARLWARRRAKGREIKEVWDRELKKVGLRLQGYEVRGWRRITRALQVGQVDNLPITRAG